MMPTHSAPGAVDRHSVAVIVACGPSYREHGDRAIERVCEAREVVTHRHSSTGNEARDREGAEEKKERACWQLWLTTDLNDIPHREVGTSGF